MSPHPDTISRPPASGDAPSAAAEAGPPPGPAQPPTRVEALVRWLRSRLESPSFPLHAALLSAVLAFPSLWAGLQFDDFYQRLMTLHPEKFPWIESNLEFFTLAKDDPAQVERLIEAGVAPWWTDPHLRLSLWRPLTSLIHRLEYTLFPDRPLPLHGAMLLLQGILVWIAGLLYRQLLGPGWPAGLATLLFAVDDGHASAAAWISCHNTFLVAIFGLASVSLHRLGTVGERPAARWWSIPATILALASNEGAVVVLAFLVAHALWLESGPRPERLLRLWPQVLVFLAWFALRHHLGHGAVGSGFYTDPLADAPGFCRQAALNVPVLLFGQWGFLPANLFILLSRAMTFVWWGISVAGCLLLALALIPELRDEPLARFFGAGMFLSLVPIAATIPADRLLFFPGFASFGLMALFCRARAESWTSASPSPGERARRWVALGLLVLHGPLNAFSCPGATFGMRLFGDAAMAGYDEVMHPPPGETRRIVIVNGPSAFFTAYANGAAAFHGVSLPPCLHLAPGIYPIDLERPDDRTLVVRPQGGFLQEPGTWNGGIAPFHVNYPVQYFDLVHRGRHVPFRPGDVIKMSDVQVQVRSVDGTGMPAEVAFVFTSPPDSPAWKWFAWRDGRLRPFTLPGPGTVTRLPAVEFSLFPPDR